MFGCTARVGISSLGVPKDIINQMETEEDLDNLFKKNDNEQRSLENINNDKELSSIQEEVTESTETTAEEVTINTEKETTGEKETANKGIF